MRLVYGSLDLTAAPYLIEFGLDTGAPENVSQALAFLLQDGEIELSDRASNRTLQFNVLVEGTDLGAMADAEAALIAETEKPLNTVTIDPGNFGPATVYETFRAQVTLARDDNWESNLLRRYTVTVRALPFPRSVDETTAPTLPVSGSTTTTLDNGAATTGWTGLEDGVTASVSVVSGAVTVTGASTASGKHALTLRKTFAATTSAAKLLVVDWKPSVPGPPLEATGDGVVLPLLAEGASPTSGFVRSWFFVEANTLANLSLEQIAVGLARTLAVDNIAVTDQTFPTVGSGRQQIRSLTVGGSARAPGALSVESETAALGDGTLVYVWGADTATRGYQPALRNFRTAGNTVTTDAAMVSGKREPMDGSGVTLTVPLSLFPRGLYTLVVRLAYGSISPISYLTVTRSTVLGGNTLGATSEDTLQVPVSTSYKTFALARFMLPTVDVDPVSSASLSINLLEVSGAIRFDEAWLFNNDIGHLIWVDCGTGSGAVGGSARRLFIGPPTVERPLPLLRMGHSADGTDSYHPPVVKSWQFPVLPTGQVNVLAVTPNATDAVIDPHYYKHWHTNAAD